MRVWQLVWLFSAVFITRVTSQLTLDLPATWSVSPRTSVSDPGTAFTDAIGGAKTNYIIGYDTAFGSFIYEFSSISNFQLGLDVTNVPGVQNNIPSGVYLDYSVPGARATQLQWETLFDDTQETEAQAAMADFLSHVFIYPAPGFSTDTVDAIDVVTFFGTTFTPHSIVFVAGNTPPSLVFVPADPRQTDTQEDTDDTLSITIVDTGANAATTDTFTVSLTRTSGSPPAKFELGTTNGLTVAPSTDPVLSFTGLLTHVNTALSQLTFRGCLNCVEYVEYTLSVDDGDTEFGTPATTTDTISFNINSVNDNPTITLCPTQTTTKNTPVVFSSSISVGDVDDTTLTVELTVLEHGTIALSTLSGLTLQSATINDSNNVIVSGTIANLNTALTGLIFTPQTNVFGLPSPSVQYVARDDSSGSSPVRSTTIVVNALNEPLSVSFVGGQTDINDGTISTDLPDVTLIDTDATIVEATLSSLFGQLTLSTTTGLTFLDGTVNGDSTITVEGSLADVDAGLDSVSYLAQVDQAGIETLVLTVDDRGSPVENVETATLVFGVLQPPSILSILACPDVDASVGRFRPFSTTMRCSIRWRSQTNTPIYSNIFDATQGVDATAANEGAFVSNFLVDTSEVPAFHTFDVTFPSGVVDETIVYVVIDGIHIVNSPITVPMLNLKTIALWEQPNGQGQYGPPLNTSFHPLQSIYDVIVPVTMTSVRGLAILDNPSVPDSVQWQVNNDPIVDRGFTHNNDFVAPSLLPLDEWALFNTLNVTWTGWTWSFRLIYDPTQLSDEDRLSSLRLTTQSSTESSSPRNISATVPFTQNSVTLLYPVLATDDHVFLWTFTAEPLASATVAWSVPSSGTTLLTDGQPSPALSLDGPGSTTTVNVTVTARNQLDQRTYTLLIERASFSDSTNVSSLLVSWGVDHSQSWTNPTVDEELSIEVDASTVNITLIVVTEDDLATVTVSPSGLPRGPTSTTIILQEPGQTTLVNVTVTAANGHSRQTLSVEIHRAPLNGDNRLRNVVLWDGEIAVTWASPPVGNLWDGDVLDWVASPLPKTSTQFRLQTHFNEPSTTTVTALLSGEPTSVSLLNGTRSPLFPMGPVGDLIQRMLWLTSTAEDGTWRRYNISLTRLPLDGDSRLLTARLRVDSMAGTNLTWSSPSSDWDADVYAWTANVTRDTEAFIFVGTWSDTSSVVASTGLLGDGVGGWVENGQPSVSIVLPPMGETIIVSLTLEAENGSRSTYTITVSRQGPDWSALAAARAEHYAQVLLSNATVITSEGLIVADNRETIENWQDEVRRWVNESQLSVERARSIIGRSVVEHELTSHLSDNATEVNSQTTSLVGIMLNRLTVMEEQLVLMERAFQSILDEQQTAQLAGTNDDALLSLQVTLDLANTTLRAVQANVDQARQDTLEALRASATTEGDTTQTLLNAISNAVLANGDNMAYHVAVNHSTTGQSIPWTDPATLWDPTVLTWRADLTKNTTYITMTAVHSSLVRSVRLRVSTMDGLVVTVNGTRTRTDNGLGHAWTVLNNVPVGPANTTTLAELRLMANDGTEQVYMVSLDRQPWAATTELADLVVVASGPPVEDGTVLPWTTNDGTWDLAAVDDNDRWIVNISHHIDSVRLTATLGSTEDATLLASDGLTVLSPLLSGQPSASVPLLGPGLTTVVVVLVTAENGQTTQRTTVGLVRQPAGSDNFLSSVDVRLVGRTTTDWSPVDESLQVGQLLSWAPSSVATVWNPLLTTGWQTEDLPRYSSLVNLTAVFADDDGTTAMLSANNGPGVQVWSGVPSSIVIDRPTTVVDITVTSQSGQNRVYSLSIPRRPLHDESFLSTAVLTWLTEDLPEFPLLPWSVSSGLNEAPLLANSAWLVANVSSLAEHVQLTVTLPLERSSFTVVPPSSIELTLLEETLDPVVTVPTQPEYDRRRVWQVNLTLPDQGHTLTFQLVVAAEDPSQTTTYTVHITRSRPASIKTLIDVRLSRTAADGGEPVPLNASPFDPSVLTWSASFPPAASEADVLLQFDDSLTSVVMMTADSPSPTTTVESHTWTGNATSILWYDLGVVTTRPSSTVTTTIALSTQPGQTMIVRLIVTAENGDSQVYVLFLERQSDNQIELAVIPFDFGPLTVNASSSGAIRLSTWVDVPYTDHTWIGAPEFNDVWSTLTSSVLNSTDSHPVLSTMIDFSLDSGGPMVVLRNLTDQGSCGTLGSVDLGGQTIDDFLWSSMMTGGSWLTASSSGQTLFDGGSSSMPSSGWPVDSPEGQSLTNNLSLLSVSQNKPMTVVGLEPWTHPVTNRHRLKYHLRFSLTSLMSCSLPRHTRDQVERTSVVSSTSLPDNDMTYYTFFLTAIGLRPRNVLGKPGQQASETRQLRLTVSQEGVVTQTIAPGRELMVSIADVVAVSGPGSGCSWTGDTGRVLIELDLLHLKAAGGTSSALGDRIVGIEHLVDVQPESGDRNCYGLPVEPTDPSGLFATQSLDHWSLASSRVSSLLGDGDLLPDQTSCHPTVDPLCVQTGQPWCPSAGALEGYCFQRLVLSTECLVLDTDGTTLTRMDECQANDVEFSNPAPSQFKIQFPITVCSSSAAWTDQLATDGTGVLATSECTRYDTTPDSLHVTLTSLSMPQLDSQDWGRVRLETQLLQGPLSPDFDSDGLSLTADFGSPVVTSMESTFVGVPTFQSHELVTFVTRPGDKSLQDRLPLAIVSLTACRGHKGTLFARAIELSTASPTATLGPVCGGVVDQLPLLVNQIVTTTCQSKSEPSPLVPCLEPGYHPKPVSWVRSPGDHGGLSGARSTLMACQSIGLGCDGVAFQMSLLENTLGRLTEDDIYLLEATVLTGPWYSDDVGRRLLSNHHHGLTLSSSTMMLRGTSSPQPSHDDDVKPPSTPPTSVSLPTRSMLDPLSNVTLVTLSTQIKDGTRRLSDLADERYPLTLISLTVVIGTIVLSGVIFVMDTTFSS